MDDVADRLDQASDALTALARDVPTLAVAPGAFAAPGPGAFVAPGSGASVAPGRPGAGAFAASEPGVGAGAFAPPELGAGAGAFAASGSGASAASGRGASVASGLGASAASGPGASLVPGLPARIGQALHDHWDAVLGARSREASVAAARVAEMARSVRAARRQYAETDEAVERRFTREL